MGIEISKKISDIRIGYYAFALCVLKQKSVDEAFDIIAPDPDIDLKLRYWKENEDIYYLHTRNMLTWEQIGEILNITPGNAAKRGRKYELSVSLNPAIPCQYFSCGKCGQLVIRNLRKQHINSGHKVGVRKNPLVS